MVNRTTRQSVTIILKYPVVATIRIPMVAAANILWISSRFATWAGRKLAGGSIRIGLRLDQLYTWALR